MGDVGVRLEFKLASARAQPEGQGMEIGHTLSSCVSDQARPAEAWCSSEACKDSAAHSVTITGDSWRGTCTGMCVRSRAAIWSLYALVELLRLGMLSLPAGTERRRS